MKYLSFILLILIVGCATQKRCFEKFPPDTTTTIEYIPGEIEYRDTIIEVKISGDTAYVESPWNDNIVWEGLPDGYTPPGFTVEHRIAPIRADLPLAYSTAWVDNNTLKMRLVQKDSILKIKLDSAYRSGIDTVKIIEIKIVEKPVPPKDYTFFKTGFWFELFLILILIGLLILFFKLK